MPVVVSPVEGIGLAVIHARLERQAQLLDIFSARTLNCRMIGNSRRH
jgi:hypothetical protein